MEHFDFDLGTEFLLPTLAERNEMTAVVNSVTFTPTYPLRTITDFYCAEQSSLESLLEWDSTVADAIKLGESGERVTYYLYHDPDVIDVRTTKAAVECGGSFSTARSSGGDWTIQLTFPSERGLREFKDRCEEMGVQMELNDRPTIEKLYPNGLTPAQLEAVRLASMRGYFSVPRDTTLSSLGDELGVSSQAVSERIRRAVEALVDTTLPEPEPHGAENLSMSDRYDAHDSYERDDE
ncbi:HTH DNA binding domain-containing protein [Halovenus aranensis]|uniref:HTH DNA binding domain-containing protein n=1 Tax=Halovenus aranensis TaxID=890420 RepID=A0A1G8W5W0_9EURY|nr:helix-turn-helix domain-containing protein [Halovenus aranensis]SDJ73662.1 HTH DNA binding domain-containing protein [Halovenus aranensis]